MWLAAIRVGPGRPWPEFSLIQESIFQESSSRLIAVSFSKLNLRVGRLGPSGSVRHARVSEPFAQNGCVGGIFAVALLALGSEVPVSWQMPCPAPELPFLCFDLLE